MFPEPTLQHQWLRQLVGEWRYDSECVVPDKPPHLGTGTESVRALGDFWVVVEASGQSPGFEFTSIAQLGYDPTLQRFCGSWIGSIMPRLWIYDGELDAAGRILTLACEGPSMSGDGTTASYQDIIEIVSPDKRLFRSRVLESDGTWREFMRNTVERIA